MDENWSADIDAQRLSSGFYAAVLVLVPPPDFGPPLRHVLPGEHPTAEHARFAALDALAEMTLR